MNKSGNRVVVGHSSKKVSVYEYNGDHYDPSWVQVGNTLEFPNSSVEYTIDINNDGTMIVVGDMYFDHGGLNHDS